MKVYEDTAKSFGTKLETQIDKLKDQALKDKQAYIEKERKAYDIFFVFHIKYTLLIFTVNWLVSMQQRNNIYQQI